MKGKCVFLHLSDLHFGDENENDAARRRNTLKKLLHVFKDLPAEWKPQSIAISGDIAWSGVDTDYRTAEAWLTELLETLGLSSDDIIPVAGNHDINLDEAAATAVPSGHINADKLLELDGLEKVSEPFRGFEDFCKRMKIPPLRLGSKTSFLAGAREHKGVMWLVLNSAWFCRGNRKEELHIGLPHLEVITAAEEWEGRGVPTVAVLHHPPECLHDEEIHSYGNRRNTYDFLTEECEMILSGHVHGKLEAPHAMFLKSYLFTGGASYKNEKELNNFSIFAMDLSPGPGGKIERRAYEWDPGSGKWGYREIYPTGLPLSVGDGRDLRGLLLTGSRRYYEDLRGESGRFRHLDISDIILQKPHKTWLDSPIKSFAGSRAGMLPDPPRTANRFPTPRASSQIQRGSTLLDIIPQLWREGCRHAVVKGDGGMGKTVSLVRLWDEFTREYDAARPVPVFIQLNEINTVAEEKRMDFILSIIRRDYFNGKVGEDEILGFLREGGDVPSVVLLLDGFNEVTVDNNVLLIQVRKLMEQARGVQVVITSRYDMREAYGWEHLHLLELVGLEEWRVKKYLKEKKVKMPGGRLADLLRNPMMLTLYTSTCEVQGKYKGDFRRHAAAPGKEGETAGELLWNFIEAQVAVLLERLHFDQKKWWYYKFLLKFMLPAVGYEMERAGLYAFDRDALYGVLDRYCLRFSRPDFFRTFPDYGKYEDSLPAGASADERAGRKRVNEIEDILCNVLLMVVKEGKTYRFLHQDFRDYFAALHVLNETEMGLKRGEVAVVLKERALPVYIRRFMGEIEGEFYQRPVFQEGKGWEQEINENSLLNRVLGLCRGVFDGSVGFGPWNVVEVWKEVRGELSGAELSELNLSRVVLNGTWCSRFFGSDYLLAARFDGSLVHEMCLFPRGHSNWINSAAYSGDGKKILSASYDHTIKEWDVESGQCVKTFSGHNGFVNSAAYSGDGKKILSASHDNTIKEWNVENGHCVRTFYGHTDWVRSARYSEDEKKVLSVSEDNTIKEWDVESEQCVKTFPGHENGVTSARYSGDGKKILSTSHDNTIKEWDVESGQCVRTFYGHTDWVRSARYSGDGKKILSVSEDHTIKEWNVESGQCVKTFPGHENGVTSARYSGDGEKILSTSHDHTIKEWDVESGQCVKTFSGHSGGVMSARYSGDGKKILSASYDRTIIEWDVESGQCVKAFSGHTNIVTSVRYSKDGKKILSVSNDGTIKEWDVESGQCVKTTKDTYRDLETRKNLGHTGELLEADDNKIIIKSRETGKLLRTFINIPGLFIHGCSFKNLHPDSDLSDENKKRLRQYGALL